MYVTENTLDMEQCERLIRYKFIITFVPNLSHNFKFTIVTRDFVKKSTTWSNLKYISQLCYEGYMISYNLHENWL